MYSVLGYQYALLLASHSLSAAEAHVADVLDEVAQASGRLVFGQGDLATNWSDLGLQNIPKGSSQPRGQLAAAAAAVVSPVAALLLGVAAALYQQRHKKQFQSVGQGSTAGSERYDEANLTADHSSDCKAVDAAPKEGLEPQENFGQEGVGSRKLLSTLLPAVASAAISAHQSVVAFVARIRSQTRNSLDRSMLPKTGTSADSSSSCSKAGSHTSELQVQVPTINDMVNTKDTYVASFSCSTSAASASTSGSSTRLSSNDHLHGLSVGLSAAAAVTSSGRQDEIIPVLKSQNGIVPSSSCSSRNLEEAIRRGVFVNAEGQPDLSCITKALINIAAGLSYLHSMGAVHGDLKPANVLLKHTTRGLRCNITGYGSSTVLGEDENATFVSQGHYGTLDYTAPEVLLEGSLTSAADMYSFGLIMWEMYTGTRVFGDGLSLGQIYCMVALHGWRPEVAEMPADYAALMQACWHADRQQRPTIGKVLLALQKPRFSGELTGYWEPRGLSTSIARAKSYWTVSNHC